MEVMKMFPAGKYFLECYKKRPDVLMEASDVTGELRLCMQIISTCSFEDEQYGQCILDKIQMIMCKIFRQYYCLYTDAIDSWKFSGEVRDPGRIILRRYR